MLMRSLCRWERARNPDQINATINSPSTTLFMNMTGLTGHEYHWVLVIQRYRAIQQRTPKSKFILYTRNSRWRRWAASHVVGTFSSVRSVQAILVAILWATESKKIISLFKLKPVSVTLTQSTKILIFWCRFPGNIFPTPTCLKATMALTYHSIWQ